MHSSAETAVTVQSLHSESCVPVLPSIQEAHLGTFTSAEELSLSQSVPCSPFRKQAVPTGLSSVTPSVQGRVLEPKHLQWFVSQLETSCFVVELMTMGAF